MQANFTPRRPSRELDIDHDKMIDGVRRVFARKGEAVVESNVAAVEAGYAHSLKQM